MVGKSGTNKWLCQQFLAVASLRVQEVAVKWELSCKLHIFLSLKVLDSCSMCSASADSSHTSHLWAMYRGPTMPMSSFASILLCLLISFTAPDAVLGEGSFVFTRSIHNIATGGNHVIVAIEDGLYLFNHTLYNLTMRDPRMDGMDGRNISCPGERSKYHNKILLVYDDIVLCCWNENLGACREYNVSNLTLLRGYGDNIVSCNAHDFAAGIILQLHKTTFVTAAPVKIDDEIRILTVREKEGDHIFSFPPGTPYISPKAHSPVVNFVDAFEWKGKAVFPYNSFSESAAARLIVLEGESLNSQYNLTCGTESRRGVILSSFAFDSSGSFFWAGVFTTNGSASANRTALCIYNLTFLENVKGGCIHTDFSEIYPAETCVSINIGLGVLMGVTGLITGRKGEKTKLMQPQYFGPVYM